MTQTERDLATPTDLQPDPANPLKASVLPVTGWVWIESTGAVYFAGSGYAGTRGRSLRMEAFSISINPMQFDVGIAYNGWVQERGATPVMQGGQMLGTQGEELRLEEFSIWLTGPQHIMFTVEYMAHQENNGDIGPFSDGQLCGSTGQGLRLEGLAVTIRPANNP